MTAIKRLSIHIAITVVVIVLGVIAASLWATQPNDPTSSANPHSVALGLVIFLTGAVGGVANNYRRLLNVPLSVLTGKDSTTLEIITFQIYISPIVGAVFAFVLYLLFMSNLLQGGLFPAFTGMDKGYSSFTDFASAADPVHNLDAAKAIVWAFIAGFSEGLVPNFIDKIVKETAAKEQAKGETSPEPTEGKPKE